MSINFIDLIKDETVKPFEQMVQEIIELLANPTEEFDDVPF